MPELLLLGVLVLVAAAALVTLVVLAASARRRDVARSTALRAARWEVATTAEAGRTVVSVERVAVVDGSRTVLGRTLVASIDDGAPDWQDQLLRARIEAQERAAVLALES